MLKVRREGKVCEGVREEVVYRDAPTFKTSIAGLFRSRLKYLVSQNCFNFS